MKKLTKVLVSVFAALTLCFAAIACDGTIPLPINPENPNGTVTYTVTYALNGGDGTLPTETAKEAGAKFNLASAEGLSKTNSMFDGWSDGTSKYDAGAEYTMPANNVTLTAQWKANGAENPPRNGSQGDLQRVRA